jgi:hypothetical protein
MVLSRHAALVVLAALTTLSCTEPASPPPSFIDASSAHYECSPQLPAGSIPLVWGEWRLHLPPEPFGGETGAPVRLMFGGVARWGRSERYQEVIAPGAFGSSINRRSDASATSIVLLSHVTSVIGRWREHWELTVITLDAAGGCAWEVRVLDCAPTALLQR